MSKPTPEDAIAQDLRQQLPERLLARLRESYTAAGMIDANAHAMAQAYPPLGAWMRETAHTFYGDTAGLAPRDRERCMVTLLAYSGPCLPLAVHVYWGLMEGLSVDEVCRAVALAGCYGGLAKLARAMLTVQRVLVALRRLEDVDAPSAAVALNMLIDEFSENG